MLAVHATNGVQQLVSAHWVHWESPALDGHALAVPPPASPPPLLGAAAETADRTAGVGDLASRAELRRTRRILTSRPQGATPGERPVKAGAKPERLTVASKHLEARAGTPARRAARTASSESSDSIATSSGR